MLVNFSNHGVKGWTPEQLAAAENAWKNVEDMAFPNVSPSATKQEVEALAQASVDAIMEKCPDAVMVQGEMTLVFSVVSKLKEMGVTVVAATTERVVEIKEVNGETIKTSVFKFIQFREY